MCSSTRSCPIFLVTITPARNLTPCPPSSRAFSLSRSPPSPSSSIGCPTVSLRHSTCQPLAVPLSSSVSRIVSPQPQSTHVALLFPITRSRPSFRDLLSLRLCPPSRCQSAANLVLASPQAVVRSLLASLRQPHHLPLSLPRALSPSSSPSFFASIAPTSPTVSLQV